MDFNKTMSQYIIRQLADNNIEDIWLYTAREWGTEQADNYLLKLYERFSWLAEHPYYGKNRADINPDYYCFPEGKHHIFYVISENKIEIIGIVHERMDVLRYFD